MLETLRLTNFRQHSDLTLAFKPGLNVIRGSNEQGKSTLIEGISYNWFGTKALRTPIAEVVSWGKPLNSLQTETVFTSGGTKYRCVRGSRGAELYINGNITPMATGQTDVTAVIEKLFGITHKHAFLLLIAAQNDIRGIVEQKDTTSFIEKLLGFSDLDQTIYLVKERVPTGNTKALREEVADLQARIDAVPAPVKPAEPDVTATEAEILELGNKQKRLESDLAVTEEELAEAVAAEKRAAVHRQKVVELQAQVDSLRRVNQEIVKDLQDADVHAAKVKFLKAERDRIQKAVTVNQIYAEFRDLPTAGDVWDGTRKELDDEIRTTKRNIEVRKAEKKKLEQEKYHLENSFIKDKVCPTCKQEIRSRDSHNEKIRLRLQDVQKKIEAVSSKIVEDQGYVDALAQVALRDDCISMWAQKHGEYVTVAEPAAVPPTLEWIKAIQEPVSEQTLEALDKEIAKEEMNVKIHERSQKKLERNERELKELESDLATAQHNVPEESSPETIQALRDKVETLRENINAVRNAVVSLRSEIDSLQKEYKHQYDIYKLKKKERTTLQTLLDKKLKLLNETKEYNALLKSIREARVKIMDAAWNTVLQFISDYFTQLRGRESIITKEQTGFQCNGSGVKNLSGSTRDILGLATRFALTKLMFPDVGLQILDEPGAGCDAERNSALMQFVITADFPQALVVTHNDLDEIGASNVIVLE